MRGRDELEPRRLDQLATRDNLDAYGQKPLGLE